MYTIWCISYRTLALLALESRLIAGMSALRKTSSLSDWGRGGKDSQRLHYRQQAPLKTRHLSVSHVMSDLPLSLLLAFIDHPLLVRILLKLLGI